ncbi:condensation domain-containing protein [Streptomyces sp. NPDC021056]|uniref:condensation domain-containing protein n=1 Tax=Streptomyces sp. NPDC021056 TaxID=3155012 RepID=UPI003400DB24
MADIAQESPGIDFHKGDSKHGPGTWGQRHIWASLLDNRGNPERFTMRRVWPVPTGRTVADVVAALRTLTERHEALRTRLDVDRDALIQVVLGSGTLACTVTDSAAPWCRATAAHVASELSLDSFAHDGGPPVRFGVLSCEGGPQWVAMAISHLLVDADACAVLAAELAALLDRTAARQLPLFQPLQRAGYELSPDGKTQNERALRFWRTTLEQHPDWLFPSRADGEASWQGARFPVVQAHAPGLGRHVEELADQLRISAAALCTAAFCQAFAAYSDATSYPLGVTCSNRVLPWSRGYVGSLAQQGVIGVQGTHAPLDQLARRASQSLLQGHRFSLYDQDDVFALIDQVGTDKRDFYGPVSNFVNFQYRPAPIGAVGGAEHSPRRDLVITEAAPQQDSAVRFGLHIGSDTTDLVVRISLDQACVSEDTMRAALREATDRLWSLAP